MSGSFGVLKSPCLKIAVPALMLLGGCEAATTVTGSVNPSRAQPAAWADYDQLPVELHGVIPNRTKPQLAALFPPAPRRQVAALGDVPVDGGTRRMVLYVNPASLPAPADLCSNGAAFRRGAQQGESAHVTGALCDGNRLITRASGRVLTADQSDAGLRKDFQIIRDQLYQSLYFGANTTYRYYR